MFVLPTTLVYLMVVSLGANLTQAIVCPRDSIDDYAPSTNVPCPDLSTAPLIRTFSPQNQSLHPLESQYIQDRLQNVIPSAWKDWLGDGSTIGYNLTNFTAPFSKVGIALPGGGLRAAQFGAAALAALDGRNSTAKAAGTGGLLQVASYITGLSGGSWTIGSLFFNDFPMIQELVFGDGQDRNGWLLDIPFVTPDGDDVLSSGNQAFYGSILQSIISKARAGVDTSLTDPWSRMISYHFLNQTSRQNFFTNDSAHGAGQLWSHIPTIPSYQSNKVPFPVVVANSRPSGSQLTTILPLNSTVYEITPLEFASFDPSLSAAVNISFVGTHLTDGRSSNGSSCVVGLDQAGFVMGTSASLFNQLFDFAHNTLSQFSQSDSSGLTYVLSRQLSEVRTRAEDVANWPNPFNGLQTQTFQDANATWLELIDGSSNQENIPYNPLFVKSRDLDVVVTLEGSADTSLNWPNGTGLIFSALRQTTFLQSSHKPFPLFPVTPDEFISTGVNSRPTFFGCDPPSPPIFPLIIYLPNSPPVDGSNPVTNTPTFQLSYTQLHTSLFFDQVFNMMTSGFVPNTNSPDSNWGKCFQCAVFDRSRLKAFPSMVRSDICSKCFAQYCFDPNNPPSVLELPNRKLNFVDPNPLKTSQFFAINKFKLIGGLIGLIALVVLFAFGWKFWKKQRPHKKYFPLHFSGSVQQEEYVLTGTTKQYR